MADFISRETAIDVCDDDGDIIRIRNIPAADVVEVVRCSACKKVVLEDQGNGKSAYWCPVNRNYRCWDEFCNRGERMADNG